MPLYSFICENHGEHDILAQKYEIPKTSECPKCGKETMNVLTTPSIIAVKLDWNDKASEMQSDPYTQAKAQMDALDREDQLTQDAPPKKWREEQYQEAAKQIDNSNKGIGKPVPVATKSMMAKAKKVREKKKD